MVLMSCVGLLGKKKLHGMLMIIWCREFPSVKISSAVMKVYVRFLRYLHWEALNVLTKVQVINLIGVCFPHKWRAALRCSLLPIEAWICNAMIHLNKCLFDWDPLLWKCLNFSWQVIVMVWQAVFACSKLSLVGDHMWEHFYAFTGF